MGSLSMDTVSMNPYEKQLYSVFKTFDVDNEEALNKSAVVELCDALQLEDRGTALVDSLFERRADRVTFTQFRNGLLSVLGGGDSSTTSKDSNQSTSPTVSTAVSATAACSPVTAFSQSDEDSSGREVAPRIVFGSKKYGRRSRPQRSPAVSDESPSPRAASVSRLDTEDKRLRNSQRMRYRRSTSAMDTRERQCFNDNGTSAGGFDHNRRINYEQALSLCHELRMDGIDRRIIERIFDESHSNDTTVGEFFDRLNASLTSSIQGAHDESLNIDQNDLDETGDDENTAGMPSNIIVGCWESAGIPQPGRLLMELGFTGARVRPPDLEHALDEELRTCAEPLDEQQQARALFLTAALELDRLRLRRARRRVELTTAERDKLRGDVAEANRRASLLAQDNDENHARMEAELAASVRRAETRLAEVTRQATSDITAERERAAAARTRLETELEHRAETEARLREEMNTQASRIDALEARAAAAESRAALAERSAAHLAEELEAARAAVEQATCGAARGDTDERAKQLAELRAENQRLRDRNDELCCALEAGARAGTVAAPTADAGDLSAELGELLRRAEECDSSPCSMQRAPSFPEAARRLRELLRELPRELPDLQEKVLELSNALLLMEQYSLGVEIGVQTDEPTAGRADGRTTGQTDQQTTRQAESVPSEQTTESVDGQIATCNGQCQVSAKLRQQLAEADAKHEDEKQKLNELVKELELSLEQLKEEYERCEEYWSGKLEEERDALAEEQRLGDERLAELAAKITDYERQFAPSAGLPTIQEGGLEAQVTELEEEFADYRRHKEDELRERDERIARLGERLSELQARGAACGCAVLAERCAALAAARGAAQREAAALRARAARADAAVRRLHARLHAADLLVKDLYVENCQLAHRRAL